MKPTSFLMLLSILVAPFFLRAQAQPPLKKIYLKDGGFVRATIIASDSTSLGGITLKLQSGDTIRLQQSSITSIKSNNKQDLILPKGQSIRSKGPYFNWQMGALIGYSSGSSQRLVAGFDLLSMSFGHRFNPQWQVGGGFALDVYDHSFLPLFIEARYFPIAHIISPYLALQTGYSFAFNLLDSQSFDNYGGGALVHPALGIRVANKKKGDFLIEAGYRFQWGTSFRWAGEVDKIIYRRIAIRFGWEF